MTSDGVLKVDESLSSCPCQVCHTLVNPVDEDSNGDGVLGGLTIEEWNVGDVRIHLVANVFHLEAVFKAVRSLKRFEVFVEMSTRCGLSGLKR